MDDVDTAFAQQFGVAGCETVDVDGEKSFVRQTGLFHVLNRRTVPAVAHVAPVPLEPVEHFASGLREHLKFLLGFGDMRGDKEISFARGFGAKSEQFRMRWNRARAGKAQCGSAGAPMNPPFPALGRESPPARAWSGLPVISRNEKIRSGVAPHISGSNSGAASMSAMVVVPVRRSMRAPFSHDRAYSV